MKSCFIFTLLIALTGWGSRAFAQKQGCGTAAAMAHLKGTREDVRRLYEDPATAKMVADSAYQDSTSLLVVPIVFHLMYTNNSYAVTDSQIVSQIDALNQTYGRYGVGENDSPLGRDSRIRFCLAAVDPEGNPTTGIERLPYSKANAFSYPSDEDSLKYPTSWDSRHYLNVWLVNSVMVGIGFLEGYAYFPPGIAGTPLDGIVLDNNRVGIGQGCADSDSEGKTLTHEIGHYLNLYHTWGDSTNCNGTDYVDDTPPCAGQTFTCNSNQYTCYGMPRQVANYMDYSPDYCQVQFTRLQIRRMRYALMAYRPELVSAENLVRVNCTEWLDSFPVAAKLTVYPNPAMESVVFSLDIAQAEPVTFRIYDINGQERNAWTHDVALRGPVMLDVRGWRPGIYFIRAEGTTFDVWRRLMIVH